MMTTRIKPRRKQTRSQARKTKTKSLQNNYGKRFWGDDMLDIIKQAALEAMGASMPMQLLEATVLTPPPALSIQIGLDTKNPIPAEMIQVAEHLTNHTREVEFEGDFEIDGVVQEATFKGAMIFTDELQAGEKVAVISVQGGQSFYIAGRVM